MFSFVKASCERQDYRPTGSSDVTGLVRRCPLPPLDSSGHQNRDPSMECRPQPGLRTDWATFPLCDLEGGVP